MSKDNSGFFKEKKIWSIIKDELLGCYLKPYLAKVASSMRTLYVDCFAGKGKFDDGADGSPFIALNTVDELNQTAKRNIKLRFIELNYAQELEKNIGERSNCKVIQGKFEEQIFNILQDFMNDYNVFLYVDPYGVKALDYQLFTELPKRFRTAELLINLNNFGFIREACRIMKADFDERTSHRP